MHNIIMLNNFHLNTHGSFRLNFLAIVSIVHRLNFDGLRPTEWVEWVLMRMWVVTSGDWWALGELVSESDSCFL